MSARSAASYEHATEVLFQGCQDAMQRQTLAPLARHLRASGAAADGAGLRLLEVASGTGRFHTFVKDNLPAAQTVCSDLSPYYLAAARENLEYFAEFDAAVNVNPGRAIAPTLFVQAAAEALPFPAERFDALLCVYLFHELPGCARAAAAAEFARVLAPGGILVLNDSLQRGDRPEMDALLPKFPERYHEPYYMSYVDEDMGALFAAAGLEAVSCELAHVSKVWAWRKPAAVVPSEVLPPAEAQAA